MASLDNARNCLLLAAIPLAMSIVNVNWLFTPIGSIDPWVNVGYFLHYSDPTFLNSYYKIARLSWIIPGFAAYQIFSPVVASYVLHVGCLLVSIVFFYLTVARLFGPTIAFATAACFAVFVPFHGSGGWDYQNAPAGAYYILAFYLLTTAPSSKDIRWPLIGAGAAYAAAVHAAIGFVNLAPILPVHFLVLYCHQRGQLPSWSAALRASACFLLGAILLTVLLGLVNVIVGRDFLFFKILANFAFSLVRNSQGQATWWLPWGSKWYLKFGYLYYFGFVVAVLVGCACSIITAIARKKSNPIALSLEAQFLFAGILWIVWQSVGQTALQPDYFAYPLYPPMFFALAAIAASWRRGEIPSKKATLLCAVLAAVLFCSMSFPVMSVELFNLVKPHVALFLIISIAIVVALFAMSGGQRITTAAAVFAFATVNGVWTVGSVDGSAAVNPYGFGEVCGDRAAANGALVDSHLFLTRLVPHPESMFVWWNEREQLQNDRGCRMAQRAFAASLVSSGLRYLAPPWEGMPGPEELPASSIALISGAQRIAVPTTDYRNVERLMRRYEDDGEPLEIESRQTIGTAQFNFQLYVLRSRPPTREAMSTATPIRLGAMKPAAAGSSLKRNRSGVMFRSSPAAHGPIWTRAATG